MGEEVYIVAIVFGSFVAIAWMIVGAIARAKERSRSSANEGAVGVRELEERIRQAVESAVEPLLLQMAHLEETIRQDRALPNRERETQLLRSHEEE